MRELCCSIPTASGSTSSARFARRMCEAAGADLQVRWGRSRRAIRGAEFVITQLRVGGQAARHRDELTGREFGLIGQETTGVGGFAKALRTIPVMLDVARMVEREAPDAVLVNFTNPAGLMTELLRRHTSLAVVGLCNVPWNMQIEVAAALGVAFDEVSIDYVGLNHLSWARGFRVAGEDRTAEVLALREQLVNQAATEDEPGCAETIAHARRGAELLQPLLLRDRGHAAPSGGNAHARLAGDGDRGAAAGALRDQTLREKPEELMERGGRLLLRVGCGAHGRRVRRRRIGAGRQRPQRRRDPEPPRRRRRRDARAHRPRGRDRRADRPAARRPRRPRTPAKDYELLTIEAALSGDRSLAALALLSNPLGPDASLAPRVWERLRTRQRRRVREAGWLTRAAP